MRLSNSIHKKKVSKEDFETILESGRLSPKSWVRTLEVCRDSRSSVTCMMKVTVGAQQNN